MSTATKAVQTAKFLGGMYRERARVLYWAHVRGDLFSRLILPTERPPLIPLCSWGPSPLASQMLVTHGYWRQIPLGRRGLAASDHVERGTHAEHVLEGRSGHNRGPRTSDDLDCSDSAAPGAGPIAAEAASLSQLKAKRDLCCLR